MRPVQYRREPEPLEPYLKRLYQGTAGLIGLLEMYEKQATRDRFRELSPLSRRMDQHPSQELARQFTDFIQRLYEQLRDYEAQYPKIARKRAIHQRKNYLEEILSP